MIRKAVEDGASAKSGSSHPSHPKKGECGGHVAMRLVAAGKMTGTPARVYGRIAARVVPVIKCPITISVAGSVTSSLARMACEGWVALVVGASKLKDCMRRWLRFVFVAIAFAVQPRFQM